MGLLVQHTCHNLQQPQWTDVGMTKQQSLTIIQLLFPIEQTLQCTPIESIDRKPKSQKDYPLFGSISSLEGLFQRLEVKIIPCICLLCQALLLSLEVSKED